MRGSTRDTIAVGGPQSDLDSRFFAIVTDLVGAPTELVDEADRIAWHTRTTIWGETTWNVDFTASTPLRFPCVRGVSPRLVRTRRRPAALNSCFMHWR